MKKLGFGMMRLPLLDSNDPKSIDAELTCKMVDEFLSCGFTYFDTAYMYHDFESQAFVRKCLVERHPRNAYTIANKLPLASLKKAEDMQLIFDEQLQKCGVSYFDYYLAHSVTSEIYDPVKKFGVFDFMRGLKNKGLVRKIGFSFHDKADFLEKVLAENPDVDFVQLQINYADWEDDNVQSRKCYETVRKRGIDVVIMEPVKGGTLAKLEGKAEKLLKDADPEASIASWAVRFASGLDGVFVTLSGMSNMEQMKDNLKTMGSFKPLSSDEQNIIWKVRDIISGSDAIPCTACEYCLPECPSNIAIPKYFELYNKVNPLKADKFTAEYARYDGYAEKGFGKASDCIACRKCERVCPQHIVISEEMIHVAQRLEGKNSSAEDGK